VTKDRAAPFSRKHRRYWIPVTGGMLLIGLINVLIGVCTYSPPPEKHEQIHQDLIKRDAAVDAPYTIAPSQLPAEVMRAFAIKYPRTIPTGASIAGGNYQIDFPPGAAKKHAIFTPDGTFVSDE
jgi:hypothetical protein